ncbi:MAG: Hsp33 family molecular chaperone HslO [Erysipelotrichaceae bacterium]|nr:Hsp33 family molecular chaperone HslO [Erysipelotrichaceae bacterium]
MTYLENLNLKPISSVFEENPDIHKYLYELFPDAQILEERYVEYHCDCSRERFMRNFLTLPMKDLEEIAQEEDVEVKCEICNKSYHFNQDDMKTIMSYANKR